MKMENYKLKQQLSQAYDQLDQVMDSLKMSDAQIQAHMNKEQLDSMASMWKKSLESMQGYNMFLKELVKLRKERIAQLEAQLIGKQDKELSKKSVNEFIAELWP